MNIVAGIFIGGRGTRMGGVAKGLLAAPDTGESLLLRLVRICREAVPAAEIVCVGQSSSYGSLALPALPDDPPGVGPMGGLKALLDFAASRNASALALATDLPFVTTPLVARLAAHAPEAPIVAPRVTGGPWHALFARYAPARCAPLCAARLHSRKLSLQGLFDDLGADVVELPLSALEEPLLHDWDVPEDIAKAR